MFLKVLIFPSFYDSVLYTLGERNMEKLVALTQCKLQL